MLQELLLEQLWLEGAAQFELEVVHVLGIVLNYVRGVLLNLDWLRHLESKRVRSEPCELGLGSHLGLSLLALLGPLEFL